MLCKGPRKRVIRPIAICLPNCHDPDPPCTAPMTSRPMPGRYGTRVDSWDFSTTAKLPLDSCTVPVSLAVTGSPSLAARSDSPLLSVISALTQATSRSHNVARKVALVGDPAVPAPGGVSCSIWCGLDGYSRTCSLKRAGAKVGDLAADWPSG